MTRDGNQRYRIDLEIEGLPEPASLGDFRTYVAWRTIPVMDPVVRLGEVGNGVFPNLGPVAFDKFVILVSAEPSAALESRTGRLALRGPSPSTRILSDNHLMVPVSGPAGATPVGIARQWLAKRCCPSDRRGRARRLAVPPGQAA